MVALIYKIMLIRILALYTRDEESFKFAKSLVISSHLLSTPLGNKKLFDNFFVLKRIFYILRDTVFLF